MEIEKYLVRIKWFFFREGFLYILILCIIMICAPIPGIVQTVNIRKLNDMACGIKISQLYEFTQGKIPASAVEWDKLIAYFRMILKFSPDQEDAEMFLGFCEYYGRHQEKEAFEHFCRSADNLPYLFWNLYDNGLILFSHGDNEHAILYFQMALLAPGTKLLYTMGNSILYRQFFPEILNQGLEARLINARENLALLLAAAFYYQKDYNMAELFAKKGAVEPRISNREPFYFYAGAVEMAKGNPDEAISYFKMAIKARSRNPLVYTYAADILRKSGRIEEAQNILRMGQAWGQGEDLEAFPYPGYLRLRFY